MVWMIAAVVLAATSVPVVQDTARQEPVDPVAQSQTEPATQLEEVVVNGRPLADATVDFVARVVATPRARGAATWNGTVCLGTGNLRRPTAEALIERISMIAEGVGLTLGRPGCQPRVFIVFAEDADAVARDLVEARGDRFRIGVSGSDRGDSAVQAFVTSDRPVRWWQASVPVNAENGQVVARLPGQPPFEPAGLERPSDFGPQGVNTFASRLRSPLRDDLAQVVMIVDIDQVAGVDFGQLADYLAMVALAQIDPDVDVGPYNSILSLFDDPETAPTGLTDWDQAFLAGLYGAVQTSDNSRARLSAVADTMARRLRDRQSATD
jgi:hypothetical protein